MLATAVPAVAALLFAFGAVSAYGFSVASSGNLLVAMGTNDFVREALSSSSWTMLTLSVFVASFGLLHAATAGSKLRWLYRQEVRGIPRGGRSRQQQRLGVLTAMFFIAAILGSCWAIQASASRDAYERANLFVQIQFCMAGIFGTAFAQVWNHYQLAIVAERMSGFARSRKVGSKRVRQYDIQPPHIRRLLLVLVSVAFAATLGSLSGSMAARSRLFGDATDIEISGAARRMILLKYLDMGVVAFDHCANRTVIIPWSEVGKISPRLDRDIHCGVSGES